MTRRILATLAALALSLIVALPAAAGGWAEIVADEAAAGTTDTPPRAGQPFEIGFLVLQHGRTPAAWEVPIAHFTEITTGETVDVVAVNDRADGHFTATVTLPTAGHWRWQVTLKDLISEHQPAVLAVHTTTGAAPAFDPAIALTAIERARLDVTSELEATYGAEIQRIDGMLTNERARTDRLTREVESLRSDAGSPVSTTGQPGTIPVLGFVGLALLAGAAAGFATAWLATRPRPTAILSPAPREPDPA